MSNKCWICLESSLLATEITTTSGKPIVDIIKSVLTSKSEENSEFSIVCQLCFEVIDEIDVFEQSLLRSKQKLEDRHCDSKNTADDKAVKPSPEHESFVSVIDPNQSKDLEYETEAPKKKGYMSKLVLRGRKKSILEGIEYYKANLDMALHPPQEPSKIITSFSDVNETIMNSAIETIEALRNMPQSLTNTKDQLKWDLIIFEGQVPNLHFGIPGESQCHNCHIIFNNILERLHHYFTKHDLKNFQCQKCSRIFNDWKLLYRHLSREHQDMSNRPRSTLDVPVPILTKAGVYNCDFCSSAFTSQLAYYHHFLEWHKPLPEHLICSMCEKQSFSNPLDLKRHVLIHHGGYSHICLICNKRYTSRGSILTHLRDHTRTRKEPKNRPRKKEPRTCPECGMVSKSQLLHDRHLLSTHGIQVPQVCQVCQETLPDPKAMVEHKRSQHSNETCYICAKSFLNVSDLNLHISRMHPEIEETVQDQNAAKLKPVKIQALEQTMCEICSKMVSTRNIQGHMKNHQDKELTCPKCPRMFRWKSSLTSHLTSAHGDSVKVVLVACEFCGKQFNNKSNLRQHRYSHTGGPYSCKCGRGFARKDMLQSHMAKCMNPTTLVSA